MPGLWPWLENVHGFSGSQIGTAFAVGSIGALLAPFYAGQLADRVLRADGLLGIFYLALAGLLGCLARAESYGEVLLLMGAMGLFWAPTIGLTQSICLTHLGSRDRLGPVRAWGTVGWVLSGILVGQWLLWQHTPTGVEEAAVQAAQDAGRVDGVWLSAGLALVQGLFCLVAIPPPPPSGSGASFAPAQALRHFRHEPLFTLVVAALLLACVARYYMIHAADYLSRWGRDEPGWLDRILGVGGTGLMSLGQVAEVGLLFLFPLLSRRFSVRSMLLVACSAFVLRMVIFTWADALPLVLVGVGLHGICFTLFFFTGFLVVDEVCPASVRTSGQTLFQLVFGGLGGGLGSLVAGEAGAWAEVDGSKLPERLFLVPLALSLLATAWLAWRYPRQDAS